MLTKKIFKYSILLLLLTFTSSCYNRNDFNYGSLGVSFKLNPKSSFSIKEIPQETTSFEIKITGVGINEKEPIIKKSEIIKNEKIANIFINNIPKGKKEIIVKALDKDNNILAEKIVSIEIKANEINKVTIELEKAFGSLDLKLANLPKNSETGEITILSKDQSITTLKLTKEDLVSENITKNLPKLTLGLKELKTKVFDKEGKLISEIKSSVQIEKNKTANLAMAFTSTIESNIALRNVTLKLDNFPVGEGKILVELTSSKGEKTYKEVDYKDTVVLDKLANDNLNLKLHVFSKNSILLAKLNTTLNLLKDLKTDSFSFKLETVSLPKRIPLNLFVKDFETKTKLTPDDIEKIIPKEIITFLKDSIIEIPNNKIPTQSISLLNNDKKITLNPAEFVTISGSDNLKVTFSFSDKDIGEQLGVISIKIVPNKNDNRYYAEIVTGNSINFDVDLQNGKYFLAFIVTDKKSYTEPLFIPINTIN